MSYVLFPFIPTGKKNNGLEVYERIQPANESQSYFPYHFDVDVVAGSRQIRNNPKPNKLSTLSMNTLTQRQLDSPLTAIRNSSSFLISIRQLASSTGP